MKENSCKYCSGDGKSLNDEKCEACEGTGEDKEAYTEAIGNGID